MKCVVRDPNGILGWVPQDFWRSNSKIFDPEILILIGVFGKFCKNLGIFKKSWNFVKILKILQNLGIWSSEIPILIGVRKKFQSNYFFRTPIKIRISGSKILEFDLQKSWFWLGPGKSCKAIIFSGPQSKLGFLKIKFQDFWSRNPNFDWGPEKIIALPF